MPKALIIGSLNSGNKYLDYLYNNFSNGNWEVKVSVDAFWDYNINVDLIHIQWIESIFNFELESLCDQDLNKLKFRLNYLREKNTKIIVTRHNKSPHLTNNRLIQELFFIVYKYCTGIIHLGQFSIAEFKSDYPFISNNIKHIKINHGHYLYLKNNLTKSAAKRILKISNERFVILIFGTIRSIKERNLALKAFRKAKIPQKTILFNRWQIQSSRKLNRWQHLLEKIYIILLRLHPQYAVFNKFTKDDDIQVYLNAADILFIPRLNTLNSGNLFLGLSFGKCVVGPEIGNLTEVLSSTKNVTFDPQNISSAVSALEKSYDLVTNLNNLQISNMEFMKTYGDWKTIAGNHISFYKECL